MKNKKSIHQKKLYIKVWFSSKLVAALQNDFANYCKTTNFNTLLLKTR